MFRPFLHPRSFEKTQKINFKLFVVALGYENRHYKYIFTGCFLKATANRNHVFLLAVNLGKQSVKMNLH
jgi:hypothetical protein